MNKIWLKAWSWIEITPEEIDKYIVKRKIDNYKIKIKLFFKKLLWI